MLKKTLILSASILIVALTASFFRHSLCRSFLISQVEKNTGLTMSIDKVNLDILNSTLNIEGVSFLNPPGFKNEKLGEVKQIFIRYNLFALLQNRIHFYEIKATLGEINIIQNENGQSNISLLKANNKKISSSQQINPQLKNVGKKDSTKEKKKPKLLIDRLEIVVGKVSFLNYRAKIGQSAAIIFTVNSPCVFKNVTNLKSVVNYMSTQGGFKGLLNGVLVTK